MLVTRYSWLVGVLLFGVFVGRAQGVNTDTLLEKLLRQHASNQLKQVLDHPEIYQYQLIYTEISRDKRGNPHLKNRYLNVDDNRYFNPASMVKLPTALIALEKMEELTSKGVNRATLVKTDTTTPVSIEQLVREAFIVSDNDAYNTLFQVVGQEALNRRLQQMGYNGSRITRRFIALSPEEHRHTGAVELLSPEGNLLVQLPARTSRFAFDFSKRLLVGNAHYNWSDSLIHEPMDFTTHNQMPLRDLQTMLQAVLFPATVPAKKRWKISEETRAWVLRALSDLPSESSLPVFDTAAFFDSYTKFFLYRDGRRPIPKGVRVYNKTGWSYGYLIDVAYIKDTLTGRENMLSGVIYVNADGVLNDNKYEYEQVGYPFFREIGEILFHRSGTTGRVIPDRISRPVKRRKKNFID